MGRAHRDAKTFSCQATEAKATGANIQSVGRQHIIQAEPWWAQQQWPWRRMEQKTGRPTASGRVRPISQTNAQWQGPPPPNHFTTTRRVAPEAPKIFNSKSKKNETFFETFGGSKNLPALCASHWTKTRNCTGQIWTGSSPATLGGGGTANAQTVAWS